MNYSKDEKEPAGQGQAFQVGRGEQRPWGRQGAGRAGVSGRPLRLLHGV